LIGSLEGHIYEISLKLNDIICESKEIKLLIRLKGGITSICVFPQIEGE